MKEEKVKIKNSKGVNLAGIITQPEIITEKLAILCPGFLDTKDYSHLGMLAEELVKKNFTVVRFDPTGTWESDGDISEYTNSQYIKDIESVIMYMLERNKYTYILLGGHSRGGTVSILYAARDPRISVVVDIMGSLGLLPTGQKRIDWEQAGFIVKTRDIPNKKELKEFKVPFSHLLDLEQYNTLKDIKNIHVPIFFIAGENDKLVTPEEVTRLLDQANDPKNLVVVPNIGHDYRHNSEEIKKVNLEIIKYIDMIQ